MYTFDAVSGAEVTIDMPRDYPYRLLQIQALKTGAEPYGSITALKLSFDADKYVPVDVDADHQIFDNMKQFGPITQILDKRMTNVGDILYVDIYHGVEASAHGETTLIVTNVTGVTGEQVVVETLGQT